MQRLVFTTVLAGCLTAFASMSFAQDAGAPPSQGTPATTAATAAPADVTTAATPDSSKVVTCKTEQTTGSFITKRICHTASEWKQLEQNARDLLERRQGWGRTGSGP
jgi:hypothetical protein